MSPLRFFAHLFFCAVLSTSQSQAARTDSLNPGHLIHKDALKILRGYSVQEIDQMVSKLDDTEANEVRLIHRTLQSLEVIDQATQNPTNFIKSVKFMEEFHTNLDEIVSKKIQASLDAGGPPMSPEEAGELRMTEANDLRAAYEVRAIHENRFFDHFDRLAIQAATDPELASLFRSSLPNAEGLARQFPQNSTPHFSMGIDRLCRSTNISCQIPLAVLFYRQELENTRGTVLQVVGGEDVFNSRLSRILKHIPALALLLALTRIVTDESHGDAALSSSDYDEDLLVDPNGL